MRYVWHAWIISFWPIDAIAGVPVRLSDRIQQRPLCIRAADEGVAAANMHMSELEEGMELEPEDVTPLV